MRHAQKFKDLLKQFLSELSGIFPEKTLLRTGATSLTLFNAEMLVDMYLGSLSPYFIKIVTSEQDFLDTENVTIAEVNVSDLWKDARLGAEDKESIFEYIQQLLFHATLSRASRDDFK